jgi:hypothetical protein
LERVRPHHDLSAKIEGIALMLQLGCEPRAELAQYPLLKKARKTLTPTGDESAKSTKPGTPLEQLVAEFSGPLPAPYRKLLPQSSADGLYGVEQALKELRYWREEHDIAEDLVPLGDNGLGDIWFLNLTSGEVSEWLHEESRWQTVAPTLGRFLTRLRRSRGSP